MCKFHEAVSIADVPPESFLMISPIRPIKDNDYPQTIPQFAETSPNPIAIVSNLLNRDHRNTSAFFMLIVFAYYGSVLLTITPNEPITIALCPSIVSVSLATSPLIR